MFDAAQEPQPTKPPKLKFSWLEVSVVLAAFYLPQLVRSIIFFFQPEHIAADAAGTGYNTLARLGQCLVILYLILRSGRPVWEFGLKALTWKDIPRALGLLVLIIGVAMIVGGLVRPLSRLPGANVKFAEYMALGSVMTTIYMAVGVAFEEILFRSYLSMKVLQAGLGRWAAILWTSLLFAVPHVYQGWLAVVAIFPIGVLLGAAFLGFGSIWPVYLAHLAYDLFVTYVYLRHYR